MMRPTAILLFFSLLWAVPQIGLAAYVLDKDFGSDGIVTTDIGFLNENNRSFDAIIHNDKLIVIGASYNQDGYDFAILKYNMDGQQDDTFSANGEAVFKLADGNDVALSGVVLEDGSIVAAGYVEESETVDGEVQTSRSMVLQKITENGFEDQDFGIDGMKMLDIDDLSSEIRDISVDSEKRIVVAGVLSSAEQQWAYAARFNSDDGSLDVSFGTGGYTKIEMESNTVANYIDVLSDGKIILGGTTERTVEDETILTAALFRLNADGTVDIDYAGQGMASFNNFEADSAINDGVVIEDDAIVVTGYRKGDERSSIFAAKLDNAGTLDTTFGESGTVVQDIGFNSVGNSLTTMGNGNLLLAGDGNNSEGNDDVVLVHLDSSGNPKVTTVIVSADAVSEDEGVDPTVAIEPLEIVDGMDLDDYELIAIQKEGEPVTTDINGDDDSAKSVAVASDGTVYVAGYTSNEEQEDIALLSFVSDTDGSGDTTTDSSGTTEEPAYHLVTMSVTGISRNGAMTGGVITENSEWESEDETDRPTVSERGVVYAVVSYPSYKESETSVSDDTAESDNSVFPAWVTDNSYNYELVRWGRTSDGSGAGTYGSDITKITPDVFYYVRAYAKLSDDTILYGNQLTFRTEDVCFIATAAYGSIMESHVSVLRQFRDKYLQNSESGQQFIQLYYHFSPKIAELISESSLLRFLVRVILLPLVGFSYFMVALSLQLKIAAMVLMAAIFFMGRRFSKEIH